MPSQMTPPKQSAKAFDAKKAGRAIARWLLELPDAELARFTRKLKKANAAANLPKGGKK